MLCLGKFKSCHLCSQANQSRLSQGPFLGHFRRCHRQCPATCKNSTCGLHVFPALGISHVFLLSVLIGSPCQLPLLPTFGLIDYTTFETACQSKLHLH